MTGRLGNPVIDVGAIGTSLRGNEMLRSSDFPTAASKFLKYMFTLATMLFFVVSPGVMQAIGWHYIGGGPEFEKIHVATYLLVVAFAGLWLADRRFRQNVTDLCRLEWILAAFVLSVGAVALYAVLVKHLSIAPFVDTFLAAVLVAIAWICLPLSSLSRLRRLLDIYFAVNIGLLFLEYAMKSWVIAPAYDGPFRAVGFFENPLSAGMLLGVYAIVNLVSTPLRFSRASALRLILGLASLLAIMMTGGRTAIAITVLLLITYAGISAVQQITSGRVNRAAVVYGFLGSPLLAVCLVVLWQLGLFDTMLSRFEFDYGSSETRQIALDFAANMPTNDVWLGLSPSDIGALVQRQSEMHLVAIEISWINFLLTCGWILTVPLFVTYALFLLRFIPRYCGAAALLPSILLLIVTAASNGIWAKTTVLTASFAIILAFLRQRSPSPSSRLVSHAGTRPCAAGLAGHDAEQNLR